MTPKSNEESDRACERASGATPPQPAPAPVQVDGLDILWLNRILLRVSTEASDVETQSKAREQAAAIRALRKGLAPPPAPGEAELPPLPVGLDWPDKPFTVRDGPGEHDPCWLVMPGGEMLALNHHAINGVDQARARFIADACNASRLLRRHTHDEERAHLVTIDQRDHAYDIIDKLCNAVLGVDRHEWSSLYGFDDAVAEVEERIAALAQPLRKSNAALVLLTGEQIKDLAEFAGLRVDPEDDELILESEFAICECPPEGVHNDGEPTDPKSVSHYALIAYCEDCPDEGCVGLGPEIAPQNPGPDTPCA